MVSFISTMAFAFALAVVLHEPVAPRREDESDEGILELDQEREVQSRFRSSKIGDKSANERSSRAGIAAGRRNSSAPREVRHTRLSAAHLESKGSELVRNDISETPPPTFP